MALLDPKPLTKADQVRPGRPRRAGRLSVSIAEWRELRALKLFGWPCRVCGVPSESLHHIVPRSRGGGDIADNLAGLCGDGFRGCHGLVEAHDPAALRALAESLTDAEYAYAIESQGEGAMERLFGVEYRT